MAGQKEQMKAENGFLYAKLSPEAFKDRTVEPLVRRSHHATKILGKDNL